MQTSNCRERAKAIRENQLRGGEEERARRGYFCRPSWEHGSASEPATSRGSRSYTFPPRRQRATCREGGGGTKTIFPYNGTRESLRDITTSSHRERHATGGLVTSVTVLWEKNSSKNELMVWSGAKLGVRASFSICMVCVRACMGE